MSNANELAVQTNRHCQLVELSAAELLAVAGGPEPVVGTAVVPEAIVQPGV